MSKKMWIVGMITDNETIDEPTESIKLQYQYVDATEEKIKQFINEIASDAAKKSGDVYAVYPESLEEPEDKESHYITYSEWRNCSCDVVAIRPETITPPIEIKSSSDDLWIVSLHEIGERSDSLQFWQVQGSANDVLAFIQNLKFYLEEENGVYYDFSSDDDFVVCDDQHVVCINLDGDFHFLATRINHPF